MFRLSDQYAHGQGEDCFQEALFILAHAQTQSLIDYCESSFSSDDERSIFALAFTLRRLREDHESTTTTLRAVNRGVTSSTLDDEDVLKIVHSAYSDDSPEWQHLERFRQSPEYAQARERYQHPMGHRLH